MADEVKNTEGEEVGNEFEAAFNQEAEKRDDDVSLPIDSLDNDDVGDVISGEEATAPKEDSPFDGWPQVAIDRYNSQLRQNQDLQHRIDSDSGRVSAFQKKVDGLEQQISDIASGGGAQPTNEEINDAMKGGESDWASFTDDYPEVAAAIDKRFNDQQQNIDTAIAPVINKYNEESASAAVETANESVAEVAKVFPTWQTEVQTQEYRDWYAIQPPGTQALGGSDDTRDASLLIGLYDDYLVANGSPTIKQDPAIDTGVTDITDEVAERRNRQLEDGATLPSRAARIDDSQSSGNEFDDAFNAFAARKDANRQ